jgi:hypothetical protein
MFLFLAIYKGIIRILIPEIKFNRKHSQPLVSNSIAMPTISALEWIKRSFEVIIIVEKQLQ